MPCSDRAEQQRAQAADAVADRARDEPADDAAGEHQREHLRAARGAVAEVAAVGDDVHLRHRHRHAAGDAGDAEQRLRRVHRQAERARRRRAARRAPRPRASATAASAGGRPRMKSASAAIVTRREDAHADVGLAPADALDEVLHDRRPDRAGDIVAAGADRHRDAAPALEPERGVGDQRREASPSCRTGRAARRGRARRSRCCVAMPAATKPTPRPDRADQQRHDDAAPVGQAAHEDAADAEADHQQRVRQRGVGARDAELGLHARQDDGDDVHRAADGHRDQRDGEPRPRVGRAVRVRSGAEGRAGIAGA